MVDLVRLIFVSCLYSIAHLTLIIEHIVCNKADIGLISAMLRNHAGAKRRDDASAAPEQKVSLINKVITTYTLHTRSLPHLSFVLPLFSWRSIT